MCLEEGVLKVVILGRGANDWPYRGFALGTRDRKVYRLTIKWVSAKTFLRVFSTDCFKTIGSDKKFVFLNMSAKLFSKN